MYVVSGKDNKKRIALRRLWLFHVIRLISLKNILNKQSDWSFVTNDVAGLHNFLNIFKHVVIRHTEVIHFDIIAFISTPLKNSLSKLRFKVKRCHSIDSLVVIVIIDLHHYFLVDQNIHDEVFDWIEKRILGTYVRICELQISRIEFATWSWQLLLFSFILPNDF